MIDVGANLGQYATRLRAAGWAGPILSIEPIPEVHRQLGRAAAADPAWEVAPPLAVGAADGEVALEVSAESDMSSTLAPDGPAAGDLADLGRAAADRRAAAAAGRR